MATAVECLDELIYFDLRFSAASLARALVRVQGLKDVFVSRPALRRLPILRRDRNVVPKQSLFLSRPTWN